MGTSIASPLDYCRRTQDVKLHRTEFLVILNGMGTSIASPLDYCRRTQDVKLHRTEFLVILNGMGTSIASPLDYCRRTQDVKLHRALWLWSLTVAKASRFTHLVISHARDYGCPPLGWVGWEFNFVFSDKTVRVLAGALRCGLKQAASLTLLRLLG